MTSARAGTARRLHPTGRLAGVVLMLLLATACGNASGPSPAAAGSAAEPPSVFAWYANLGIRFAHTEVSDRKIADLLAGKKGSPVIYVPQLAEVPPAATSKVYIFSNGIQPEHRSGPSWNGPSGHR